MFYFRIISKIALYSMKRLPQEHIVYITYFNNISIFPLTNNTFDNKIYEYMKLYTEAKFNLLVI